jgi:pimeloyl-ACP methyl ester carboxylesterase
MTANLEQISARKSAVTLRSRYVVANGVRTHYTEAGDNGPVIVALHGGGAGSSGDAGMGGLLPELAADFRVIAIDGVGGFGFTDPAAPAPYGVQSRTDHVAAVVDALGLDKFIIVGNSQGAWVAAKYAIQHPDRVTHMLLIASATIAAAMGIPEEFTPGFKALSQYDFTPEGMRRMLEVLCHRPEQITQQLVDSRYKSSVRPGAKEALAAFVTGHRYLQSDIMRSNFDMRTSLPELTKHIPTASVWGEQDALAPAKVGRQLQALLPDVAWHFIDQAGHQVQTDQPEQLAQIIRDLSKETPEHT